MASKYNSKAEDSEKTLFKAADKLRKNIDAAEYKHIALGLIFLKYISDSFEAPCRLRDALLPKLMKGEIRVTLCTYIRNKIHHQENTNNVDYTNTEMKDSIIKMIEIIKQPWKTKPE